MPRAISQVASKNKRKKILKLAKGNRLGRGNLIRSARHAVHKGLVYAYRDRKARKREFRNLWITRISAAVKEEGMSYSVFMGNLIKSGIEINRKILSELAIHDREAFRAIVNQVRTVAA